MSPMMMHLACFGVPVLLAPFGVMGLRYLFAIFVREGAEIFADVQIERSLSIGIGQFLAIFNVAIFVVTWWSVVGCDLLELSISAKAALAVGGVLLAMILTVMIVRDRVGVQGRPGILVGLLAFTGGNLPLFLLVPATLALR